MAHNWFSAISRQGSAPLCLAFALAWGCASVSAPVLSNQVNQTDPRQMTFAPVVFTPPTPERVVLDNGMVVYLLEGHELPLVTVTATIRTGGWLDPADKIGLAGIAGATMRSGGTQRTGAGQLDRELEHMAATISTGIGTESGSAMLDILAKDLPRGLRLFADVLMTPASCGHCDPTAAWPDNWPIFRPPRKTGGIS